MKIAITADPEIPVPPILYGGIERIIFMLIEELHKEGHDIILFAHKDSKVPCKLIPYPSQGQSKLEILKNTVCITRHVLTNKFDVIHSFGRLAYLTFVLPLKVKKIMSYQREPTISQVKLANKLAYRNSLVFTGCSEYIAKQIRPYATAFAVHNFVDINNYDFKSTVPADAPLMFLGRVEKIKGTHLAIEIARKTGNKLIIAGNIPNAAKHQEYFEKEIKPHIDDDQIKYVGPVNDSQKNELLGGSKAFLMPILWDEPFGIVMAEAMACGTPVIGLRRGAVPEVITEGMDGYICTTVDQMIDAVNNIVKISRLKVREACERKFSSKVIADEYTEIYKN
jgi:glycosyltransferase involved in cell wall biosynthesis